MYLPNSRSQQTADLTFDASGTITTGSTPQLVLPQAKSRAMLYFQNISTAAMYVEFGSARAHAVLTSGKVSSIVVDNGGFGFTIAPLVQFFGGGNTGWNEANSTFLGCNTPGYPSPPHPAIGTAVLSGGSVASITINDPGLAYAIAPYVRIVNSPNDPYGCATPSATSGVLLVASGGSLFFNGTTCPTDQLAVFCATQGAAFTCKYLA